MSGENKQGEKVKSILSADVPPFIPRNCNVGLLNNTFTTENGICHAPQYMQDTVQTGDSEWHVPVVPPASSGIMLLPVTPFLHPDYQFQSSQASNFRSTNNQFPSKGKKWHGRKHFEGRSVSTVNETNVYEDSFSYVPAEIDKRQKEASSHLNSKRKSNRGKYNIDEKSQLNQMTMHKTLSSSVKLDNAVEFPSLPTVSTKDNVLNEMCNRETYQLAQHCSYSSILKSTPKNLSELNQKAGLSINDKYTFRDVKREKMLHQNTHRKQEAKKKYNIHNKTGGKVNSATENEGNDGLKNIKNQRNCIYQIERDVVDQKQSSSKVIESVIERGKTSPKKHLRNNRESTQIVEAPNKSVDCSKDDNSVMDPIAKPQKSEKRRKRNKKKKKVDPGKVSLLSPEMFENITNKLNEVSKVNQNDGFNLCDQQDFPDLGQSSSLTHVEEKSSSEKFNTDGLKENKISLCNTSSNEKPFNLNFSNLRKPTTYSDILQTAKFRANEKVIQTTMESMKKSTSNSKNEDKIVEVLKKKEKKKKKKKKSSDGSLKKVQTDIGKQAKSDSVIQISLANIVTSLQQVKLNKTRKKETKTRVISTKRGIMDKIANPHNMLDSSAPMKKRGKEREKPGRKRLSAMRKIILREREKRRMCSLQATKFKSEDEDDDTCKETDEINADVMPAPQNFEDACEQVDGELQASKIILHTKKFRDYCDHMISEEIDCTVLSILKDLVRFQDRLHEKDPIKARMKRRLVYGLREVTKHLRICKLKCIIIAPNIEKISSEGGLSDALQVIVKTAQEQGIPYIFALQRRMLGKVCMKIVPVSCVGIFNYEGVEESYRKLLEFLTEAREKYKETLKIISAYITEDIKAQLLQTNILPTEIQLIRSEVLSKIAMRSTMSESTLSEESNIDKNIDDVLERIENVSAKDDKFVQNKESAIEINAEGLNSGKDTN